MSGITVESDEALMTFSFLSLSLFLHCSYLIVALRNTQDQATAEIQY